MIELKNVSKSYGSFQVLSDCSTSVAKGDVVVITTAALRLVDLATLPRLLRLLI